MWVGAEKRYCKLFEELTQLEFIYKINMSKVANRVIANTGILYLKMIFSVVISLYTTRIILEALGIMDFGLYNLIAGVVALLSFLNAAMSISTQRYLSVSQGKGEITEQKEIFSNSLLLHIVLGIGLAITLFCLIPFLFENFLNIPSERISAAKAIYISTIIAVFFSILSVPFTASLNAHENMLFIAIVEIIELLLKLIIALSVFHFSGDKLIYYGVLISIVAILSFIIYSIFCVKKYEECSFNIWQRRNSLLIKELGSFAGWNLFGAGCGIGRTQGLAVILNLFFGTIINAAYGIANQVSGQMTFFSAALLRALNAQIMKAEGTRDRSRMIRLAMSACKFSFFLIALVVIPFFLEMDTVLFLWLNAVPEYAVSFCKLVLISILINQLTIGIQSAFQAVGRIKLYQTIIGSLILLNLPIAYVYLSLGYNPNIVLIISVFIDIISGIFRVFLCKYLINIPFQLYIKDVLFKVIFPFLITILCSYLFVSSFDFAYRIICTVIISTTVGSITIYLMGLNVSERTYLKAQLVNIKSKIYGYIK